jgi:outer membrane protein assembly factor BamA
MSAGRTRKRVRLALFSLLACSAAAEAAVVASLEASGSRTAPGRLERLLETRAGGGFDPEVWDADLARLRRTELFYSVEGTTAAAPGGVAARVAAKNKFSTLPVVKFKQGGGSKLWTVGLYDVNLLRALLEAGGQYERFNGRNGFALWFRNPYGGGPRTRLGADVTAHTVDLPLLDVHGRPEAHFLHEETRVTLRAGHEVGRRLRADLNAAVYRNVFKRDDSTTLKAARNAAFSAGHPLRSGLTVSLLPRLAYGRLERAPAALTGWEAAVGGELAAKAFGSDFGFARGELELTGGAVPRPGWNLAGQARLGTKTGHDFQHKHYLGGLDSVRGFLDGQLRGDQFWQANLEARPTLLERPTAVLQGNLFTDWAKTWDARAFGAEGFHDPVYSVGVGARLILPRVYRAVLRADSAWTLRPIRRFGFSVGLQQFF